jgi:hypothetical protein
MEAICSGGGSRDAEFEDAVQSLLQGAFLDERTLMEAMGGIEWMDDDDDDGGYYSEDDAPVSENGEDGDDDIFYDSLEIGVNCDEDDPSLTRRSVQLSLDDCGVEVEEVDTFYDVDGEENPSNPSQSFTLRSHEGADANESVGVETAVKSCLPYLRYGACFSGINERKKLVMANFVVGRGTMPSQKRHFFHCFLDGLLWVLSGVEAEGRCHVLQGTHRFENGKLIVEQSSTKRRSRKKSVPGEEQ